MTVVPPQFAYTLQHRPFRAPHTRCPIALTGDSAAAYSESEPFSTELLECIQQDSLTASHRPAAL